MIAIGGPRQADAVMVSEAMPPLGQYLCAWTKEAVESIAAPKGHGPPESAIFPLQIGIFLGTTPGDHHGPPRTPSAGTLRGD